MMRFLSFIKYFLPVTGLIISINNSLDAQVIDAEQNFARNSAGVVMVQTVFSATVYVNTVEINQRMFDKLVDSVKKLDTTGKLYSPGQKLDMVVNALYKSPLRFFSSTSTYFRQAHRVTAAGTGFFVTTDGYIVTNCHIIDRDSAFIRNKFIQSTYQEVTEANINQLQNAWAMRLSDQQRTLLSNAYGLIYSQLSSMILFDLKRDIYVLHREDTGSGKTIAIKQRAELVTKGQAMPGKDVAILKIEAGTNYPTLTLSNDPVARIGTQVLVFGYPEPATFNSFLATEAGIEPTLTTGIVSGIKKSVNGWSVIQMDATISHGSSGSPVCNEKGEIVGLATFGSLDQDNAGLVSGYNFAIPVSIIKEFVTIAKLKLQPAKVSVLYNEALGLFYKQYYSRALDKFEEVKVLNKGYPELYFYIDQCKSQIRAGSDKQISSTSYIFWLLVAMAVLASVYFFFKTRKQYRR